MSLIQVSSRECVIISEETEENNGIKFCPKCGAVHLSYIPRCRCGHMFEDTGSPLKISLDDEVSNLVIPDLDDHIRKIFFDTETSGLDYRTCKIIELAMLVVEDGEIVEEYDEFIDIGERISPKITEINGITNGMLISKGISEKKVAKDLKNRLSPGTLMIAHNCQFDLSFVYHLLKHHYPYDANKIVKNVYWIDTVTILKDRKAYHHKLIDAVNHYGVKKTNSHRAIDDTKALYDVYRAMKAERDDCHEYINVFGYNPRYGINGIRFSFIEYKRHDFNDHIVPQNYILPRK